MFSNSILHHLWSTIASKTIRLVGFGSSIFRSSDKASVSTFLHGIIVVQRLLLFHWTYGSTSVAGLSHGSSEIYQHINCCVNVQNIDKLGCSFTNEIKGKGEKNISNS